MNNVIAASWNIRGLGRNEKKAAVRNRAIKTRAKLVFLQESKIQRMDQWVLGKICERASNFSFLFSPSVGSAGGLISLWDQSFFGIASYRIFTSLIAMVGTISEVNLQCTLINVYAPNKAEERHKVFAEMKEFIQQAGLPCLVGGDFNTVLNEDERSGASHHKKEMLCFSQFIEDLSLVDLPLQGSKFTWSSHRELPSFSRIDMFLLSSGLLSAWPDLLQCSFPKSLSDHNPIGLAFMGKSWGPRPFKLFD
ncbi:hypothetical protein HRI_002433000 [Hibiscus trionum]|uniref:Endonuclease/exonuclease/phosphatase domain-containing protein n=1 Tax=Hibiscus trionum TaxID=183268 RepID=A0A9W7I2C3_HIBTR|nr:hypothetical protein HRI_002433000 [Hibiscus trionum]